VHPITDENRTNLYKTHPNIYVMVLAPGAGGDGLRHAFNQNQGRDKPEAQKIPTPSDLLHQV